MRRGQVKCSCGKEFYIETNRKETKCIECTIKIDVSHLPEETPKIEEEEGENIDEVEL